MNLVGRLAKVTGAVGPAGNAGDLPVAFSLVEMSVF
jgi:hypothetical protein